MLVLFLAHVKEEYFLLFDRVSMRHRFCMCAIELREDFNEHIECIESIPKNNSLYCHIDRTEVHL